MPASFGFNIHRALTRAKQAWAGILTPSAAAAFEKGPELLNNEALQALTAAGTALVDILKVNASDQPVLVTPLSGVANSVAFDLAPAAINTPTTVIPAASGKTVRILGFNIVNTGAASGATDVRISDTNSSPVDVWTATVAALTDGARFNPAVTGAGITHGTQFSGLTAGKGVQIRKTGGTLAGSTSFKGVIFYDYV